ncbi:MAG TPA: HEAT repeat domain-containing protein [Armatimonadota bacterium]|nr:HEAT repeat domain-containing protein [Armatimonadota bacterium]
MSRAWPIIAALMVISVGLPAQGIGTAPDIDQAAWIWSPDGGPDGSGPTSYLRRKFTLESEPTEATVVVTADNGFELFINMQSIALELDYGGVWSKVKRFRIEERLHKGANIVAIKGENLGGPGGVLAGMHVGMADGTTLDFVSDAEWLSLAETDVPNWTEPDHDDFLWKPAVELAKNGFGPWGKLTVPGLLTDAKTLIFDRTIPGAPPPPPPDIFTDAPEDFDWPEGIVYVAGKSPPSSTTMQTAIWPIAGTRAFFEYDTPAPAMSGRKLLKLAPGPGAEPTLLIDAGQGLIAGPTTTYDGRQVLFAMVPEGGKAFHIYRINADGSDLTQLTDGPWQDYDPAVLPDGRIVFASTRIGSREEYHANTARSLFTLSADGEIRPLTQHIVADTEPEVTPAGRVVFVRHDNFMERAKVETHIHSIRPDGTGGEVVLGPDRGLVPYDPTYGAEDNSAWLRNLGFGCPAPLPDGRIACISHMGLTITGAAADGQDKHRVECDITAYDISPMPDGRLLASTHRGVLAVVDIDTGEAVAVHQVEGVSDLHSVVYLGPRAKPVVMSHVVSPDAEKQPDKTGYLLCQSVFDTKQVDDQWRRVKAMRVIAGDPFTARAARHQYGHIGTEGVELGEVPLAPDGSFYVEVPADRPLFLQAIDGEGRPVVNEMSWIYVRPGETRACVGCHAPRKDAPASALPLAANTDPVDLSAVPGLHRYRANNAANGGVRNLQFDRFRECASIDLYPQADLRPGRSTEVQRLIESLRAGHSDTKRVAAQRLGIFRERDSAPALALALGDSDRGVRRAAAISLSSCGTRESVPPLLEALNDTAPEVAQAAHVALEHLLGGSVAFDAYADASARRRQAAEWRKLVSESDWDVRVARLIERVVSDDPIDAQLAIESLGHIGGDAAKKALRDYAMDAPTDALNPRLAAIRGLGWLGDEAAVPLLKQVIEENIIEIPATPFKSHELGWNASPDHLAGAAAESLGRIGTPEAEVALTECFALLREFWFYSFRTGDHEWLMGCHSSIPHYRILEALDAMGSAKAGSIATALLRSVPMDPDRGLLMINDAYETVAARVLHRSGMAGGAIEACLSALGDANASADPTLVEAVTASPPAVSVGVLEPASRAAQLLSVIALDDANTPRIRAAFERFRMREASRERSWTCFFLARALGKLGDGGSVAVLRAALDEDPNEADIGLPDPPNVFLHDAMTPLYRAAAADALGRIGDPSAYPTLLANVNDFGNAMDVRQACARALGGLADGERLSELRLVADEYPEVITQRTLWESCERVAARAN